MKKMIAIVLTFTLLLGLSACGTNGDGESQQGNNKSVETKVITADSADKADIEAALFNNGE